MTNGQKFHHERPEIPGREATYSGPPATDDARSAVYDVINRRRDVRAEFSGEPLAVEVLQRVLGAAHAAPSVGNSQPWDFTLVRNPATLERFAQHVAEERQAYAESLPPERRERFDRIQIEGIRQSGLGVVVSYDPDRGGPQVLGRNTIADTGLYSTCLAIQNLWLAATAEGIGVGWVSFYREEFLAELVGLPSPVRPIAWLCVGQVTQLQTVPDLVRHQWRDRRPLAEAIHEEQYADPSRSADATDPTPPGAN